jgi:hypothetical protein
VTRDSHESENVRGDCKDAFARVEHVNPAAIEYALAQVRLYTGQVNAHRARRKQWVEYAKKAGATDEQINRASLDA